MICDELHIYKKQPAPKEVKKGKGAKGKQVPEIEENKDEIAQEGTPQIQVQAMAETLLKVSSFKA